MSVSVRRITSATVPSSVTQTTFASIADEPLRGAAIGLGARNAVTAISIEPIGARRMNSGFTGGCDIGIMVRHHPDVSKLRFASLGGLRCPFAGGVDAFVLFDELAVTRQWI